MLRVCIVVLLVAGCSDKDGKNDQDDRLDYCKRMVLADTYGDDGKGFNREDLKRAMWDKWKLSPREVIDSLDNKHGQELNAYIESTLKESDEKIKRLLNKQLPSP